MNEQAKKAIIEIMKFIEEQKTKRTFCGYILEHDPPSVNSNKVGIYPVEIEYKRRLFDKDYLVKEVIRNNFLVEQAIKNIFEKEEIKAECIRVKRKNFDERIKNEAQKKIYGRVKKERGRIEEQKKEKIFQMFNNKCSICSAEEGLHIHHKDQNTKNNRIDNLTVLCGVCHKKIHMKVR